MTVALEKHRFPSCDTELRENLWIFYIKQSHRSVLLSKLFSQIYRTSGSCDIFKKELLDSWLNELLAARGQANMADRKAKSLTFYVPPGTNLGNVKTAIEQENADNKITVFQEIGTNEYLVEMTDASNAQELIENGFDTGPHHISCHPPHGYYLNVSIMGLKAYISDAEVYEKLQQYGEIKGNIIRLKYKANHELAGLENGNRLLRMVLTSPSIPYSLQIGGEWCRIIHNNQLLICSNCNEIGHSRKNCPHIECRICHQLGHISFHCPLKASRHTETTNDEDTTPENNTTAQNTSTDDNSLMTMEQCDHPNSDVEEENTILPTTITLEPRNTETSTPQGQTHTETNPQQQDAPEHGMEEDCVLPKNNVTPKPPDASATNTKRPHQTDSDSDPAPLPRRQRIKPSPNINTGRRAKKNKDSTTQS